MAVGFGAFDPIENRWADEDMEQAFARNAASRGDPRIALHIVERRQRASAAYLAADRAYKQADQAARVKCAGLSSAAANTLYELETREQKDALQRAKKEQEDADTAYGEEVRQWQHYDALVAQRDARVRAHQIDIERLNREILLAKPGS